jgi:hypothetical protein
MTNVAELFRLFIFGSGAAALYVAGANWSAAIAGDIETAAITIFFAWLTSVCAFALSEATRRCRHVSQSQRQVHAAVRGRVSVPLAMLGIWFPYLELLTSTNNSAENIGVHAVVVIK